MRRAVVYSFLAEFATTISMVATFKIAADSWGSAGFGEWALTRRLLAFLLPLVVCGLDVAIPRFIAFAARGRSEHSAGDYMAGALAFIFGALVLASAVLFVFRVEVAHLVFGDADYDHLVLPLWALMTGYALYIPSYAYLRGVMKIMEANLVHTLMYGVLPLAALAIFPDSPHDALLGLGAISSLLAICCLVRVALDRGLTSRRPFETIYALASYGARRMSAAFGLMALGVLPAVIAAHESGVERAGFVVFGLTLVGLAASVATPLGVTVLPLASGLVAEGRVAEMRSPLLRLERWMLAIVIPSTAAIWILAPFITGFFFSGDVSEPTLMLRIAALGAGPVAYFACVRNVIDALTVKGVNARNVLIALAFFVVVVAFFLVATGADAPRVAAAGYVAALALLAILSGRTVHGLLTQSSIQGRRA